MTPEDLKFILFRLSELEKAVKVLRQEAAKDRDISYSAHEVLAYGPH